MTLDLLARRTICAALIYYRWDANVIPDAEFDEGCKRLVAEWAQLSPLRQWQLGSPAELAASGFHIKATTQAVYAAAHWLNPGHQLLLPEEDWRVSRKFRVRWIRAS